MYNNPANPYFTGVFDYFTFRRVDFPRPQKNDLGMKTEGIVL